MMTIALLSQVVIDRGTAHEPITTRVMFNREVIRILERNCLACHSPGHIKSDMPLTNYREARPWAKAIKEEILAKRMIPFQAVRGYGEFVRGYGLPQHDLELLLSWIDGGAPKGEESDYPRRDIETIMTSKSWPAGQPAIILHPERVTKISAGEKMLTRCSMIRVQNREDLWIERFDLLPGDGTIVDGASFSLSETGSSGCDAPEARLTPLGVWVPGTGPTNYPPGMATRLPADSRIILKIRYRMGVEAKTDLSQLGLYLAKRPVEKSVRIESVQTAAPTIVRPTIVRHERDERRVTVTKKIRIDQELVGIRPTPFPNAKSVEARLLRPDGSSEVLIYVRNYHYEWQPIYIFRVARELPKGSEITITAYLDEGSVANRLTLCQILTATDRLRHSASLR